jgi:hypothetical protein
MAEADLALPVEARCAAPTVAEAQHAELHDKFSAFLAQWAEAVEVADKSAPARAPWVEHSAPVLSAGPRSRGHDCV